MGFFKKLFGDAADELKNSLEDAKKEMSNNLEEMRRNAMAGFTNSASNTRDDDEEDEEPKILLGDFHDGVLTIREGFTELDDESLEHYKRIRKIVFPASLERLYSNVIDEQEQLEELDFSKVTKLKRIPDDFISGENKIRKLIIPHGVTEVGGGFLGEAKSGAEIFVPASVRKLGYITGNCNNDMTVYLYAANIDISDVEEDVKTLYVLPQYYGWYAKALKECDSEARLREMPTDRLDSYGHPVAASSAIPKQETSKKEPEPKADENASLTEDPKTESVDDNITDIVQKIKEKPEPVLEPKSEPKSETKVEVEQKEEPIENGGGFSARLEAMIAAALQDGVLTDKERELLKRRVEKEGEDWDEVEMIIEARLAEMNPVASIPSSVTTENNNVSLDTSPQNNQDTAPQDISSKANNEYPEEYLKKMKITVILPFIERKMYDIERDKLSSKSKIEAYDYLVKLSEFVPDIELSVASFISCAEFYELGGLFDDPEAKIREFLQISEEQLKKPETILEYRKKKIDALRIAQAHKDDSEQAKQIWRKAVWEIKMIDAIRSEGVKNVDELKLKLQKEQMKLQMEEQAKAKERELLKRRVEKEGEDWDEVEMIIEARLAEMQPKATVTQVSQTQVQSEVVTSVQESPYLIVNGKEYKDLDVTKVKINRSIIVQVTGLDSDEIKSLTIPRGVKEINLGYLKECEKLQINMPILNQDMRIEGDSLKEVILGEGVKSIGDHTFSNCSNLQIVDMSQCTQLEEIGDFAFYSCESLSKLSLPKSLKKIGYNAFDECSNLQIIDMSQCNSLEIIGASAFNSCSSAEFVFPEKFESLNLICGFAFSYCKKITSFPFSESLTKIYYESFQGCSNLQILDFSKCTKLGNINFGIIYKKGLDSLKKIVLPPSQTAFNALCVWGPNVHIGEETNQAEVDLSHCNFKVVNEEAFQTMDMKEIVIPDTVESIGENAFDECENLKTIVMPAALKEIQTPLGHNLEQLKKVDFSKVTQLKVIPKQLFRYGCDKLKELMIPNGVTEIEDDALSELGHLKNLFLPPSLATIGDLGLTKFSIYCFSPSLEELEPLVYGWDDDDDELDEEDLEELDEEELEELKEESKKIKINLYVLPQYVDKYISQRNAERIPEEVLIIKEIPEEFRYYYDN